MSSDHCDNCKFFTDISRPHGVCRRNPPLPVLMRGEIFDPGDTLQGYWPRVGTDDWCGDWTANDAERKMRYAKSMQGDY
jgi:hypothetical protein